MISPTGFLRLHREMRGNLPATPSSDEYQDRVDLREIPTFTIDGENARDFDDAVSIEREKDGFKLYVSISDVSHYVKEGEDFGRRGFSPGHQCLFPRSGYLHVSDRTLQ